jgi:hypothetical protein
MVTMAYRELYDSSGVLRCESPSHALAVVVFIVVSLIQFKTFSLFLQTEVG